MAQIYQKGMTLNCFCNGTWTVDAVCSHLSVPQAICQNFCFFNLRYQKLSCTTWLEAKQTRFCTLSAFVVAANMKDKFLLNSRLSVCMWCK